MPFQEVLPAVRAGGADLDAGRLGRDRGAVGSAPREGAGRGSKLQWHRDRQWQWRQWRPAAARPAPGPPPGPAAARGGQLQTAPALMVLLPLSLARDLRRLATALGLHIDAGLGRAGLHGFYRDPGLQVFGRLCWSSWFLS